MLRVFNIKTGIKTLGVASLVGKSFYNEADWQQKLMNQLVPALV